MFVNNGLNTLKYTKMEITSTGATSSGIGEFIPAEKESYKF